MSSVIEEGSVPGQAGMDSVLQTLDNRAVDVLGSFLLLSACQSVTVKL